MNQQKLREAISSLPPLHEVEGENPWQRHRRSIRREIMKNDLSSFLTFPTILATMFVQERSFISKEYDHIKSEYLRWENAMYDPPYGSPTFLSYCPTASGNTIRQIFHLVQWEQTTHRSIENCDRIVEFGGGYGSLCNIIHQMNFKGEYHIFDLPEFSLLQQHYLSQIGMEGDVQFHWVDNNQFPVPPSNVDLLIGVFSLSEADKLLREAFFGMTSPKSCLIVHQPRFNKEDLDAYFAHLVKRKPTYSWATFINPYFEVCRYLIGEKKNVSSTP